MTGTEAWFVYNQETDSFIFNNDYGIKAWVEDFRNGVVILRPFDTNNIRFERLAEMVAGCFNEKSNFRCGILRAFKRREERDVTVIKIKLDSVSVSVSRDNASKDEICKLYRQKLASHGLA